MGGHRRRPPPLVSDETFEAAQARFESSTRRVLESSKRSYLFAGLVHCCTGHNPLSMQGKAPQGPRLLRLQPRLPVRRDRSDRSSRRPEVDRPPRGRPPPLGRALLRPADLRADASRQARQAATRSTPVRATPGKAPRHPFAPADRGDRAQLKIQIQALEDGIDAELVSARIAELRAEADYQQALSNIGPDQTADEDDYLTKQLARIPDLTEALRDAPPEIKRQTFDAFDLRIDFDKAAGRIEISATASQAVTDAFEKTKALQSEGFEVTVSDIAGARFVRNGDRRVVEEAAWPCERRQTRRSALIPTARAPGQDPAGGVRLAAN